MNNFDWICLSGGLSGGYHKKMRSAQHWYAHGVKSRVLEI
jgi:hypothetical protein